MIKKQSIWFLTLFSLILVLSIYYVTIPNQLLMTDNNPKNKEVNKEEEKPKNNVEVSEVDLLDTLRVSLDDERITKINDLQTVLNNIESSVEEKNNAFEQLKAINMTKGMEQKLETKLNSELQLKSFIKIDNNQIKVTIIKKEHDEKLANDIMRLIQQEYETKMYISVRFE